MHIDDIHAFFRIQSAGSLSEAARRSGIPKATLSHQVRRLEGHLGTALFDRSGSRLTLTEAGTTFLPLADDVVRALARAEDAVVGHTAAQSVQLRIGCLDGLGTNLMGPLSLAFMEQHPGIRLDLLVCDPVELFSRDAGLDCILFAGVPPPDDARDLIAVRFGHSVSRLYAAPGYLERNGTPKRVTDLKDHQLIDRRSGAAPPRWSLSDGNRRVELSPDGSISTNDQWIAKVAVVQGYGVGCFPEFFAAGEVAAGALVPLLSEWETDRTPISILYPSHRFGNPHLKSLVRFIRSNFKGFFYFPYRRTDVARLVA